jgi:hypothetical protein
MHSHVELLAGPSTWSLPLCIFDAYDDELLLLGKSFLESGVG